MSLDYSIKDNCLIIYFLSMDWEGRKEEESQVSIPLWELANALKEFNE